MPIYEYLCESCGKVNEHLQKVGDRPPAKCDECGSRKLAKLVSRSAFQLKGGGWYSDLYASAKKKDKDGGSTGAEGSAPAGAPGDSTAGASAASDAKGPAAEPKASPPPADKKKAGATPKGSGPAGGGKKAG
jgi:putative FmdB family regulatory protein